MSIKIKTTNKRLSAHAGLLTIKELLKVSQLRLLVDSSLPKLVSGTSRSYKKFSDLIMGLVAGADCLDDMEKLEFDKGFSELCDNKVYTPKAYGDFLRPFKPLDITSLQDSLMRLAFSQRRSLFKKDNQFFFDMDSTPNRQYAKKMEGVTKNYQHIDCLDSLDVFDQYGLQYYINVRAGNTHTSQGAEEVIHKVMTTFENYKEKSGAKWHSCFRADRGYYNSGFVNALAAKHADIILGVRQDDNFPKIINQIHNWKTTDKEDESRIKFYDGRECEIGSTSFRPKGFMRRLRYVVMRAAKAKDPLFPGHVEYDYFGFCTTYDQQSMDNEEVILCYRKRGQAENYIKENKYGLDMKHYPCLKLNANRTYALISAFAYNYMRVMSLVDNPNKPVLSKKIRFNWINIPSLVARTGGNVILRFMEHHYKEMTRWYKLIHNLQFELV